MKFILEKWFENKVIIIENLPLKSVMLQKKREKKIIFN